MVILPQCRADLMIGNPVKTWGAFFGFSASSLQRMHRYQLAVSILVNASPLHYCKYWNPQYVGTQIMHARSLSREPAAHRMSNPARHYSHIYYHQNVIM